ncbi:MAG TPA: sigma-54-dependent Fis family transcriptional regulator [Gammaproteobacteria bacterium]|nr:sigma-54-dependent Fis family transcriptional regulator [Gammaproteobacteria bacterium]
MKLYNVHKNTGGALSYASLLEKIELMRSPLRWASTMERPEIQRLLNQCNTLRDEVMQLSHKARFLEASTELPKAEKKSTAAERRQALLDRSFVFEGVFGESPKLLESLEIAEKAAPTDLPVLIDGESGTGKELMAKVIHTNGQRANKPYISVNCGAIPDNLLESELFGHKRGAFTGAVSDRKGKFESADGGTIFLDEIGELPLQGQVKLLRVLQSSELQRVGSDKVTHVDTRIVAATNRNLLEMSRAGTFREDLYYRLSVINVTIPPLRERRDEIPLLFDFFGDEAGETLKRRPIQFSPQLQGFLLNYEYPGNVRELRNIIYRMSCLAGAMADITHLPEHIRPTVSSGNAKGNGPALLDRTLAEVKKEASSAAEKHYLETGLKEVHGKVVELARRINMNRSHVWTLLKKQGIEVEDFKEKKDK